MQVEVENEICRLVYRNCSPSSQYFMCLAALDYLDVAEKLRVRKCLPDGLSS